MFASEPGPTPAPLPGPTPAQQPLPIPLPDPGPFERGPEIWESGSPVTMSCANWICGLPTTVGSTGRIGASLRGTAVGGVICWWANLGGDPFDADSLSRSPPPPPPPACVGEGRR